MMVIIVNENRVELCKVDKRDYEKRFFGHRSQLYKVVPENMIRLRIREKGKPEVSEEVHVFKEGDSVAYDTLVPDAYFQEAVVEELDIYRDVVRPKRASKSLMRSINEGYKALYPMLGVIIVGAILVYAFVSGGSRWAPPTAAGNGARGFSRARV